MMVVRKLPVPLQTGRLPKALQWRFVRLFGSLSEFCAHAAMRMHTYSCVRLAGRESWVVVTTSNRDATERSRFVAINT